MAELKPCPFCGRIPILENCGDNRFFVKCKCGIAQDKLYWQRCDAIRRWNTRKIIEPQIIRCKDCQYSVDEYHDGYCYCKRPDCQLTWINDWDFYCKAGKRLIK